jgi:hypothetical protein
MQMLHKSANALTLIFGLSLFFTAAAKGAKCSVTVEPKTASNLSKSNAADDADDEKMKTTIKNEFTRLNKLGRSTRQKMSRCGANNGQGKNERSDLTFLRSKNVPLVCYCSDNVGNQNAAFQSAAPTQQPAPVTSASVWQDPGVANGTYSQAGCAIAGNCPQTELPAPVQNSINNKPSTGI